MSEMLFGSVTVKLLLLRPRLINNNRTEKDEGSGQRRADCEGDDGPDEENHSGGRWRTITEESRPLSPRRSTTHRR